MRSVAALLLTACAMLRAQHPEQESEGKTAYLRLCTACHGDNAKGGRGPDLTAALKNGGTARDISRVTRAGIAGTQMPAFGYLSEQQALAIANYLISLRGSDTAVTGDAANGERLFFGAGGCAKCHRAGGRGGRLGPNLSGVRNRTRGQSLAQAIADPDQRQTEGFRHVEVVTREGRQLKGVAKNEDNFSLQMMDTDGKLHFFDKSTLRAVRHPAVSIMPKPPLTAAEQKDVIAFLLKSPKAEVPPALAAGGVTFERLQRSAEEPENWLTHWGNFRGTHASSLTQINSANVRNLKAAWSHQFGGSVIETTPIVNNGVMYVTGPMSDAAALDARTGRKLWSYKRRLPQVASHCTVMTNRGVAILGDRVYLATLDAHLVALDATTGSVVFDSEVANYKDGFSITLAPLAIDGKIVVGVTSGECALTGFVDAYDAANGKRLWRRYTAPQKGDPERSTWAGNSADFGGVPTWMTGTYDAEARTLFWTTGNPGPDYDGTVRAGDNLWSCSVLALDPDNGRMKWFFQFTPHDVHDWDANETPILIDAVYQGKPRKLLVQANRNAFYYVLDRETGQFLTGKAFAHQTWANGLDDRGKPMVLPNTDPTVEGNYVCPDATGATNFAAPSYDSASQTFYLTVRESCATYFRVTKTPEPGLGYTGGGQEEDPKVGNAGAIRALDALTGNTKWNYPLQTGSHAAGVLYTSGNLLFAATHDGNLIALEAKTGKPLWHFYTGAMIKASPMSYAVGGKQYVAIASDAALFVFGL